MSRLSDFLSIWYETHVGIATQVALHSSSDFASGKFPDLREAQPGFLISKAGMHDSRSMVGRRSTSKEQNKNETNINRNRSILMLSEAEARPRHAGAAHRVRARVASLVTSCNEAGGRS